MVHYWWFDNDVFLNVKNCMRIYMLFYNRICKISFTCFKFENERSAVEI